MVQFLHCTQVRECRCVQIYILPAVGFIRPCLAAHLVQALNLSPLCGLSIALWGCRCLTHPLIVRFPPIPFLQHRLLVGYGISVCSNGVALVMCTQVAMRMMWQQRRRCVNTSDLLLMSKLPALLS